MEIGTAENNRASFTAELIRKDGASLGFNIDGGVDKNAPPIISKLRPGSIAYRCDELQVGDFLIAVNGIKVLTFKYEEILILLRNATDTISLTIEYDLNTLCFDKINHTSDKSTDVYLSKESGNFGFTIRGGSYGPYSGKSRPLTVTHVRPGGPADREGKIRVGDRLIGIDGIDISTCTLNAALHLLRKCKERNVCLTLEYDVAVLESAKSANGQFSLDINKVTGSEFGLNLKFRHYTQDKTVVVDSIAEASLADRCGAIKVGDEIISIDQMTLEYSTLPEVYQLLKNNDQDRIKLEIRRYGDHLNLLKNQQESSSDAEQNSEDKNERKINVSTNDSRYAKINVTDVTKNKESTKLSPDEYAKIIKGNKMVRKQNGGHHHKRARSSGPRSIRCNSNAGRSCFETGCSLSATVSSLPCGQVCRGETMELTLNCWARGGYGFIVHRSHSPDLGHQTTIISYIERGSPADKCGVLQIGDRILAINDWCTASGTAEEANYIIRHASGPLNLTVEFDVMETVLPSSGIFTVKLAKRGQNLGITLNNSATGHKGESVNVKDIRPGSVSHSRGERLFSQVDGSSQDYYSLRREAYAYDAGLLSECGSIQPDDQILSIDNIPLDTCTVDEAIRLLQKSSDIIKLRVKKNYTPFDDMEPATNTVVYTVELSRKGGPLGVTVASTDDNVDPVVISHLAPGGIAEKTGALHVGDRILAINGHSLNGKRVSEAVQLMKQNKDTVSFKIARFVLDHSRYGHHGHLFTRGLLVDRPVMVDHYVDMVRNEESLSRPDLSDADGKLGTPVQSIDSAVESLEDSPLAECQQPCTSSSNRNSQNSNSKASSVSGGGGPTDVAPFAEDLHIQLHKTLSTLKSAGSSSTGSSGQTSHGCRSEVSSSVSTAPTEDEQNYVQLGGESCPCKTHSNCDQQSHQDWMHFIDALENVSEAEMLKKLEETILSGSLPVTSSSTAARPTTPRPPPKPLNPPFPLTNTILKHPYSNRTVGSADGSSPVMGAVRSRDMLSGAGSLLLTGRFSSSSPGPAGSRQSILSGYENIPLITSPINADQRTPNDPGQSHSHDDSNDTSPGDEDECLREMPPLATSSLASRLAAGFRDNADLSSGILRSRPSPSAVPSSSLYTKNSSSIGQGQCPGLPLEFYRVTLLKDTTYNDFGFSVSDGVAEKGIFINKVRPKGPADFSGNIRPYDKLLQVNDTSLKDLDCLLAVPILAAAGDKIDLLICRDLNLILNRRPESIEEEDEEDDQQQQQQKTMQRLTLEQTQV